MVFRKLQERAFILTCVLFYHIFKKATAPSAAHFKQALTFINNRWKNTICIPYSDKCRFTVRVKAHQHIITAALFIKFANTASNINAVSPVPVYVAYEFSYVNIACKTLIHFITIKKIRQRRTLLPAALFLYRLFNNFGYNSGNIAILGVYPCNNEAYHITLCRSAPVVVCMCDCVYPYFKP